MREVTAPETIVVAALPKRNRGKDGQMVNSRNNCDLRMPDCIYLLATRARYRCKVGLNEQNAQRKMKSGN